MNEYICLNCKHHWFDKHSNITCPKCDHKYIEWINYEERWGNKRK